MSNQEIELKNPTTYSNENLSVSVTKNPDCQITFDIRVQPTAVAASYQKAIKNVNKEVSIPGFRKGKAPESVIIEQFASAIQGEFKDIVLQTGFNEALSLTKHIHPLKNSLKRPVIHECSIEKGAHFTIEFESHPSVPSVNLAELRIQKMTPLPITDDERQNAFDNFLLKFAEFQPISDRPAQEGDFINLSVALLEETPREVIHNQRAQISPKGLPSWIRAKVIGLQPGESAEGMTEQDTSLIQPDADFKSVPFKVSLHSIWHATLPSPDDQLAKKVGLETIDDLRKKINERLEEAAIEDAYQSNLDAINRELIEKFSFEIPHSHIDSFLQSRFNHYMDKQHEQGLHPTDEELRAVEQTLEKQVRNQIQLSYLMGKIATDHQINVDTEDMTAELSRQINLMGQGRSAIDFTDKENLRERLEDLALDRKIKEFLLSHATSK